MYTGMHSHVCDTVTSFCHRDVQHKENRPTKGTIYQISNLTESFISLFRVLFWGYFSFSLINVKVNDPQKEQRSLVIPWKPCRAEYSQRHTKELRSLLFSPIRGNWTMLDERSKIYPHSEKHGSRFTLDYQREVLDT